MESSRNFSRNTVGNNATVNQGNVTNITVNADASNADKSFLQEISKTDPVHDKKRILMLKGPLLADSFNWVFGHQEFSKWRQTKESGVFWIKGDPGKGKTMLLCGIIEDLEKDSQIAHLSYFFCQATDYRINTAAAVVGGLVKSLLKQQPTLLSRIRENYGDGPKDQFNEANGFVILCDIFETITSDSDLSNVICVVDALDECIKDCRLLLNLIIKTSGRVKWLLSSRNEKDIEKRLEEVPKRLVMELKQNADQISTSIDAYIRHHIQEIDALRDDEQLQEKTLEVLKSKAQGTFLWVALVVEQLHDTDHWRIEDVLEDVPKDLENLYGQILDRTERLGEKGREACRVLLSIVTTAKRPLHLEELLVFINCHWKDSKHFKTTYRLRDIRDMTKDCGSILSIREDTIYFIHQSAKDYVVENEARRIFPIQHQHYKMFEASLDAMSNVLKYDMYDLKEPGIHIDQVPLKDVPSDPLSPIRYCCVFWIEHLVSGYKFEGFEHSKYLKDEERLHCFLKNKLLCWLESLSLMRSFFPQAQIALQKLKDLIECYCGNEQNDNESSRVLRLQRDSETHRLRQFADDAHQFIRHSKESVVYWPLQLYFSAISFEKYSSTIRESFESVVREKFGPSPTLISMRHDRSSLRLQSSFYIGEENFDFIVKGHTRKPLVFSPDSSLIGRLCVNESTSVLAFWRAHSGTLECTFQISSDSEFTFLPNSDDFISVSRDGIVKRWSLDKKSCVEEQSLNFISPSPDPSYLLNSAFFATEGRVIALSPKGDLVASAHRMFNSVLGLTLVKVWDINTARCICFFESFAGSLMRAYFSPNSQLLALSRLSTSIRDVKTGATVHEYEYDHRIRARKMGQEYVCFSPNSKILVTNNGERQLFLWDTNTWDLIRKINPLWDYPPSCVAISPDSAILAATSSKGTPKFWSIDTGECVASIPNCYHSIAFAPSWRISSLVALQHEDNVIQTWLVNVNQPTPEGQHSDSLFENIIVSPDSRFVASKRQLRSDVNVWSGDDGQVVHVFEGGVLPSYPPTFSPDSKLLAYARGFNSIQIQCVITGEVVRLLKCPGSPTGSPTVSSVAFSGDSKHLVASNFAGEIYIWRIGSGKLIYKYAFRTRAMYPEGQLVAISPDSAHVAAFWYFCMELHAKIWHLKTGRTVAIKFDTAAWPHCSIESRDFGLFYKAQIFFSSDSAILVSVTATMAQIFDVATGACLQSFDLGETEHTRLLSFDQIKRRIFTAYAVYKTSSWEHWQTSLQLGYSCDYRQGDSHVGGLGTWILLNGKKNCYIPSNFRPRLLSRYDDPFSVATSDPFTVATSDSSSVTTSDCSSAATSDYSSVAKPDPVNAAMSDSLMAVVNELREMVIVRLPLWDEAQRQAIAPFDVRSMTEGISGGAGNPNLAAGVPAMSSSNLRSPIRKRRASNVSSAGDQSNSSSKGKRENKKGGRLERDGQQRRSKRIQLARIAKEAEKKV